MLCATNCIGVAISRLSRVCGAWWDEASPDMTASIALGKAEEISSILYHMNGQSIKYDFFISDIDNKTFTPSC